MFPPLKFIELLRLAYDFFVAGVGIGLIDSATNYLCYLNKYESNVGLRSRRGPGNAHFISIRQVSLSVKFTFLIDCYLLVNSDLT